MEIIKESPQAVRKTFEFLKRGGVVVCPTDTVYGFLADATNKKAVEKIYKIKKRPKSKPLPVFVKDIEMVKEITEVSPEKEKILSKYWPGEYTFVLKSKIQNPRPKGARLASPSEAAKSKFQVFKLVIGKGNTIALRIPKYKFLNQLLRKINRPLAQTSVNISGQKPLNNTADILAVFSQDSLIDLAIDGGKFKKSKPSRIIDISGYQIKKLRG